jgi:hypothetical protein
MKKRAQLIGMLTVLTSLIVGCNDASSKSEKKEEISLEETDTTSAMIDEEWSIEASDYDME